MDFENRVELSAKLEEALRKTTDCEYKVEPLKDGHQLTLWVAPGIRPQGTDVLVMMAFGIENGFPNLEIMNDKQGSTFFALFDKQKTL